MTDSFGSYVANARPWPELVEHYQQLGESFGPMVSLIRHIAGSRLATGLWAITSMHTLILGQCERFAIQREVLRVDFDSTNRVFEFEFVEGFHPKTLKRATLARPVSPPNWRKKSPAEEGIAMLEHFLFEQKKWFAH